jgi:hypothetical protein
VGCEAMFGTIIWHHNLNIRGNENVCILQFSQQILMTEIPTFVDTTVVLNLLLKLYSKWVSGIEN